MTNWRVSVDLSAEFEAYNTGGFELVRDLIVAKLEVLVPEVKEEEFFNDLKSASTTTEFNVAWDRFYNWADESRVWVAV